MDTAQRAGKLLSPGPRPQALPVLLIAAHPGLVVPATVAPGPLPCPLGAGLQGHLLFPGPAQAPVRASEGMRAGAARTHAHHGWQPVVRTGPRAPGTQSALLEGGQAVQPGLSHDLRARDLPGGTQGGPTAQLPADAASGKPQVSVPAGPAVRGGGAAGSHCSARREGRRPAAPQRLLLWEMQAPVKERCADPAPRPEGSFQEPRNRPPRGPRSFHGTSTNLF